MIHVRRMLKTLLTKIITEIVLLLVRRGGRCNILMLENLECYFEHVTMLPATVYRATECMLTFLYLFLISVVTSYTRLCCSVYTAWNFEQKQKRNTLVSKKCARFNSGHKIYFVFIFYFIQIELLRPRLFQCVCVCVFLSCGSMLVQKNAKCMRIVWVLKILFIQKLNE